VLSHDSNATASARIPLPEEILRFRASERQLHWAIAVPFMVCYTTAIVMVAVYNPAPMRPFRAVFSWIHRLSGVCLFLLPLWTVVRHRYDFALHFRNVHSVWRWRLEDVKWLFLIGLSIFYKRIELPDQGKFNAGEKLNFMFLTASYPLYILTGFLIWLPGVAFASWILHLSMAAMATPLIFGHVFMATVNPDTRIGLPGMISGYVNRHWAQHHYRHWYNEHFGHLHKQPEPSPEPVMALAALPEAAIEAPAIVQNVNPDQVVVAKPRPKKDLPIRGWPGAMQPASPSRAVSETT
jgi:formate dehydrogenase subunit gamma